MKNLTFLSNVYDPRLPDAEIRYRYTGTGTPETRRVEWGDYKRWLKDKIICNPRPNKNYTVEELKKMNMVGIYRKD